MTFAFRLLIVALAIAVVTASVPVRAAELVSGAGTRRAFSVKVVGSGHRPMILIPGLLSAGEVWESVVAHFAPSYRIHVLTDHEQEPVTAIQISAVEAQVGFELVAVNGLHRSRSSRRLGDAGIDQ